MGGVPCCAVASVFFDNGTQSRAGGPRRQGRQVAAHPPRAQPRHHCQPRRHPDARQTLQVRFECSRRGLRRNNAACVCVISALHNKQSVTRALVLRFVLAMCSCALVLRVGLSMRRPCVSVCSFASACYGHRVCPAALPHLFHSQTDRWRCTTDVCTRRPTSRGASR